MNVLIITKTNDNDSVVRVIEILRAGGHTAYRFDTDRFPTEVRLSSSHGPAGDRHILSLPEGDIDLATIGAVWYRRLDIGGRLPADLASDLAEASIRESRATLLGMLTSLDAFVMDPIGPLRRAENKALQLKLARQVGLDTPRTLTTNDPDAVRAFAKEVGGPIIGKMLTSFAIYENGVEKVVFTNTMREEDLASLEGLDLCPMTFQELLVKQLELRVTIVGNRVMAAGVDSKAIENADIDWRREGVQLLQMWRKVEIPRAVEQGLLALMDQLGLHYGAADIIHTPDGRYVFLEVNPVGEFFWLDLYADLPISQAIADTLAGTNRR
jgi:glutathione synthase/RimK-type ligase-like ATP-grasp enzyme